MFLWAAALPAAERARSFSYWASWRAVLASIVGPIWASWAFLASISAAFSAGSVAGSIFSGPILPTLQDVISGWRGSRAIDDIVSLSFIATALKYFLRRVFSGAEVHPWMTKNATKTPITISAFFRMSPPSGKFRYFSGGNDILIRDVRSSPFLPGPDSGFPGR